MKTIIITGASSGIGLASARLLSSDGHNVVLASRNTDKLKALANELGEKVLLCPTDVQDYSQVQNLIASTLEKFGKIDVLINNAGLGFFDPITEGKIEQWHETIDTNVKGLLNCIHTSLPHIIKSKGHIINLGSVAAHNVFPNSGVYCASKWAVLAISESLRMELSGKIRVTTISPGAVNTAFIDTTTNNDILSNMKDYFAEGLSPELIAQQIKTAIDAPETAVISEIIVRPNR